MKIVKKYPLVDGGATCLIFGTFLFYCVPGNHGYVNILKFHKLYKCVQGNIFLSNMTMTV